ncbi:AMP-binding protein [Nonomuraea typhae]|uniref:AMP-binding protein n=1 Tax=Nonomuraea typhae TaxID=2603600 RepID=UPI0012FC73C6|nr:AMP-binding protein [Nonomuraea typhae]
MDISELPGFYAIAAADPGRVAVIDVDGTAVSYGDLLARVNQVSHGLRARGLNTGDVVAGILRNGADPLVMLMATGQIGLYYVPVNWHLTEPETDYILRDCEAKVVVREAADVAALAEGQPSGEPEERTSGAVMWYTSGTTGFPKGVQRPLAGAEPEAVVPLYTWFLGEVCDLRPGAGVHLVTSPMYHSSPCGHSQFALHLGHTVVITPRFEPEPILALVEQYKVTNAMMVPTMFHRMLQLPEDVRRKYDLSSLAQVVHTAAACPVAVKQAIMDWWGPVLYEYYGSTESTVAFFVKPHDWLARPGTVGRPAPTFEAVILDETGGELPPGEPGMIYVKSAINTFEYRKDPAKTAASMRGEWYAPGDIGYLDEDGFLFLCDRRTDLIVSGGVNIYPAEIEAAILEHPAVADVAVIGVPDEEWGHNVVALVQPGGPVTAEALLDHLGPRLARFKHPKVIEFRETLPRTPTGKLSRGKVREDYLAGR